MGDRDAKLEDRIDSLSAEWIKDCRYNRMAYGVYEETEDIAVIYADLDSKGRVADATYVTSIDRWKSQEALSQMSQRERKPEDPEPERKYRHFKGHVYMVVSVTTCEKSGEGVVVYKQAELGKDGSIFPYYWVRKLSRWKEPVEDGSVRFVRI